MDPEEVWVKYGTGRSVKVSVPSDCDVSDLIDAIKGKLPGKLGNIDADEIDLCVPEGGHEEGGEHKEGEASYPANVLVSAILERGAGTFENPILIRTTQQALGPPNPHIDLFAYFRNNELPKCYGSVFKLPSGNFLFESTRLTLDTMIIRVCYERILSIVVKKWERPAHDRGAGIIFSGGQGNGKTWCSLFVMWYFVHLGKHVVYELTDRNVSYVVFPNGTISTVSGRADIGNIEALNSPDTIHIYDAKAMAKHEPATSKAFLIEFSSRNVNNYAQTTRRPGIVRYCIPSYDCEELISYCELFDVSVGVVRERCTEIGPSIRYCLVNDYETSKRHTENVARHVKADQLERYISDVQKLSGDSEDISACLLAVVVDESIFEDPDDAYAEDNVVWKFACQKLAKLVVESTSSTATTFIKNFITDVDRNGLTKLKGVAGNFFELVVDDFLKKGKFICRKLMDDGVSEFAERNLYGELSNVEESTSLDVSTALRNCTDESILYNFCKTFPAIDFSACDFRFTFQVTNSASHTIHLATIRTVCNHVREKYGPEATVILMFVVPENVVSSGSWIKTQSFTYLLDDEWDDGVKYRRKVQSKFASLSAEDQYVMRNLEQWVACYK